MVKNGEIILITNELGCVNATLIIDENEKLRLVEFNKTSN